MEKWTLEELQENLKKNNEGYGDAVSIGALYKKLYGDYPKIGLSGQQAAYIDMLLETMPDPIN